MNLRLRPATRAAMLAEGLDQLEITAAALSAAPVIAPHLLEMSRVLSRTLGRSINLSRSWPQLLAQSDDPDARAVLDAFRKVSPSNFPGMPIEAFCVAAAVSPLRLIEVLTGILVRLGVTSSAILAAVAQPRIVEVLTKSALTDEGWRDRHAFLKATGFIPTPKTSVSIVNSPRIELTSSAQSASLPAPSAEHTIRALAERSGDPPAALPAPTDALTPMVAVGMPTAEDALIEDDEDED